MLRASMEAALRSTIEASIQVKQQFLAQCVPDVARLCELAIATLQGGGKLMFCGNGGSSCDAAHAAGELVGWFETKQRRPYAAIALGHETPSVTAISNDAGYEHVFSRQLEALGRKGDMLIGISTSGGSKNVVAAMQEARRLGITTAAWCGSKQGPMLELADVAVRVPSTNTARIQECHLLVVHMLCAAVEQALGS
jgi:D-sedoheptulose 7-phosphate isomerase